MDLSLLSKGWGKCTLSFRWLAWLKVTISASQHKRQQQGFFSGYAATLHFVLLNLSCAPTDCSFLKWGSPRFAHAEMKPVLCCNLCPFHSHLPSNSPVTQPLQALGNATCSLALWLWVIDGRALMEVPGCRTAARQMSAERSYTSFWFCVGWDDTLGVLMLIYMNGQVRKKFAKHGISILFLWLTLKIFLSAPCLTMRAF